ncbi:RraA family protein [Futiania mangrovi]|uniref:Putative 4-hydroxy-4-methyl-2-oxoglutarate aldolase n=1 Tax=Futiania mangrovi TaxID=2959716 RepID=A0A9J6P9W6_9PROT|nr:RraA family protein [Futiania mangrovii]MCP1335757.1 RraA family protein [Futiania mangrovii]
MTDDGSVQELMGAFRALSSPIVSDALDALGIHGTVDGIGAQTPGARMCGPAFTVRYTLAGAALGRFADFMDDVPAGAVVVIDNGGRTQMSVWGDTLSQFAARNGFAGTVIDGVCRDIDGTRGLDYPMFSRGVFMRTGKGRVGIESTQQPVCIGPVAVRPGDLIFGDDTGVVVVPQDRMEDVLREARRISARDDAWSDAIAAGLPMADVWKATGKD